MKSILLLAMLAIACSACIGRSDAVNRAKEWVRDKVPYDGSKNHDGYVQGCSGMVGYAWDYPKAGGIQSGNLIPSGACTQLSNKSDLQSGDLLTCPGVHELLFDGWTDSSKSTYWGIEMSGSIGATRRSIPWPYFPGQNPSCYVFCRVNKACAIQEETQIRSE